MAALETMTPGNKYMIAWENNDSRIEWIGEYLGYTKFQNTTFESNAVKLFKLEFYRNINDPNPDFIPCGGYYILEPQLVYSVIPVTEKSPVHTLGGTQYFVSKDEN